MNDDRQTEISDENCIAALSSSDTEILISAEKESTSQECSRVLRLYMQCLASAEPLQPEQEEDLWQKMRLLYQQIRSRMSMFGTTYRHHIMLLEKLDSVESLSDVFPQSLCKDEETSDRLLLESRILLQDISILYKKLLTAFQNQKKKELQKLRKEGSELLSRYPVLIEEYRKLLEQLHNHQLIMQSNREEGKQLLPDSDLLCSPQELTQQIKELDKLHFQLEDLRNELVQSNLRLVVSIAKKYLGCGVPLVDLIQEGNIGLIKAIDKFDYELGHKFSTYATWWIKQSVLHAVGRQARVIRLPVHMLNSLGKINKMEQLILQETGREATIAEIAERLDMTRERVNSLKRMAMQPISLQAPVYTRNDGKDVLLEDTVRDLHNEDDPMRNLAKKILIEKLEEILDTLSPRTREILTLRFGLDGQKPMSLNEMSLHFRISRERIRQIETSALTKLRNPEIISKLEDYFS